MHLPEFVFIFEKEKNIESDECQRKIQNQHDEQDFSYG